MERTISFTSEGHIRIEGKFSTEIIRCGVVLLTMPQAELAGDHGWRMFSQRPYSGTFPPLYAVRKEAP